MNKLKLLLPFFILLLPLGCGEDGRATVDVIKKRITNQIQDLVGKGDIAIQKYENKIVEVRGNLIKVKVSRKTFEGKLQRRKNTLANMESSEGSPEKINLLKSTVQEMEHFLEQLKAAETKLESTLRKLIDNLDLVRLKVAHLEAKRDMVDALRTIQDYSSLEGDVDNLGGDMTSTLDGMQEEIYAIEAEIEIDNFLTQADKL
ncbi:MAG: hypothetical protein DRR19_08160 [Candidatus Parabeggiatoa sp. nov. 1]|nr:MAG: hypothetical protein DRR19_08160 [Gammaproteobacteria bacterium]